MSDLLAQFAAVVGEAHVSRAGDGVVVRPASTEEVSAVLRLASGAGRSVQPHGAGTKLGWSNSFVPDVMLDVRRLDGIVEHVWQDMTATVRGGTPWHAMQAAFAAHGQHVALDPAFADRATVGGVVATNDSGALRARYGSLRDLVLGITIVLADGTVARSGGKVVKNVAGYDLPKLLTGSFGTLGVITEMTLRMHPLPRQRSAWTIGAADPKTLAVLQAKLHAGAIGVERTQLRADGRTFALDVELGSSSGVLAEHEAQLARLAGDLSAQACGEDVWRARDALYADADATVLKITSLASHVPAILQGFAAFRTLQDGRVDCVATQPGVTHVALQAEAGAVAEAVRDLRGRLRADGGAIVVQQFGRLDGSALSRWGAEPPAMDVMRAVKREFDATGTLNPGVFVGGI